MNASPDDPRPFEAEYPPVKVKAQLPAGLRLDVSVQVERGRQPGTAATLPRLAWPGWIGRAFAKVDAQVVLVAAALAVYLLVRFIALDAFPIYFFTDEAVHTVRAADLVRDGFRAQNDEFLPTYFVNGGQYNLGVSVYLQVIPYLLFGKSIWVTRGVSVLVGLLAALAAAGILKYSFGSRDA
ncbi:MAG: hypothetical protein AAGU05_14280, partial [Anaerolineaceae bacterium]